MYILRWFNPFYERESTRPPYSICHLTPTTTLSLHSALPYLSQQWCGWHNTWTSENCLFVHSLCFEWSMWKHLELRSGVVIYEQLVIATLFPKLLYEHIAWFNLIDLWASKCVLLFDCNSSASVDVVPAAQQYVWIVTSCWYTLCSWSVPPTNCSGEDPPTLKGNRLCYTTCWGCQWGVVAIERQ